MRILFLLFFTINLFSEEFQKITETPKQIEYFYFKDLSHDMYTISVTSTKPEEFIEELNGKKEKKIRIEIGDIKSDVVKDTAINDVDNMNMINFTIVSYYKIPSGKNLVKLYSKNPDGTEILESQKEFDLPANNELQGKQPLILSITPEGGIRGDTITVKGNNFGRDIDEINVIFYDLLKKENSDDTYIEIANNKPFFLSPPIAEEQDLKFNIPLRHDILKGSQFRKSLMVRIFVSGRPSNYVKLAVLPTTWKFVAGFVGLFVVILLILFIYFILRSQIKQAQEKEMAGFDGRGGGVKRPSIVHFIESILADKSTNTFSLSRFQAFAWTVTSIGSYIYVALSQAILLRNGKIPDFNPSLVVLMSISYGGLLAANGLGSKKPKNEIKAKPAELSNLFCEGGSVDLSRLQLFGFTVVSILIYIFNLIYGNPLSGLPDIPSTLLGLMGVSQSGYLGGKAIGKEVAINTVSPDWIQVSQDGVKVSILGSGFTTGSKVLLTGLTPVDTIYISPSELQFILPRIDHPSKLFFELIPPNASPIHCDAGITIVEVGQSGYIVNFVPDVNIASEQNQTQSNEEK